MKILKEILLVILLGSLLVPAFAQSEDSSVTYVIDCTKGSEFEANVNQQDILAINFEGSTYNLNIKTFCESAFFDHPATGDAIIMNAKKEVDLNEDGRGDVIISHSNCITGQGTVNVETPNGHAETSGDYFATASWTISLLTIVICTIVLTYMTLTIYKTRKRK